MEYIIIEIPLVHFVLIVFIACGKNENVVEPFFEKKVRASEVSIKPLIILIMPMKIFFIFL